MSETTARHQGRLLGPAELTAWAAAVVVIVIMGVLALHGPFHRINKPASTVAALPGRADFGNLGCSGCHTLSSVGASGVVGPSLNHIGATRNLSWLTVQLHTPCAAGHKLPGYSCQTMTAAIQALTEPQRHDLAAFLYSQK